MHLNIITNVLSVYAISLSNKCGTSQENKNFDSPTKKCTQYICTEPRQLPYVFLVKTDTRQGLKIMAKP